MKETGERLKQIREDKGISLEEVVLATKIKMSTLRAMEEGDTKQLPSKTFIRGFVQSYARYLHANESDILDVFYNEMGSTIEIPKNVKDEEASASNQDAMKFANSTRHPLIKIFVGVGAFALIGLIYVINSTIDKYQEEKQLVKPTQEEAANIIPLENENTEVTAETQKPAENKEEVKVATTDEKKETATTEEKKEEIKTEVVEAPKEEKPAEKVEPKVEKKKEKLEAKVEEPKPVAPKKEKEEVVADKPKPAEEKKEEPKEKVKPKVVKASFIPQEVIIEALDKVELEFKADNGSWVDIELQPEQIHTIKGRKEVRIKVEDGGAINLIHNGKVMGVPGSLGDELEMKFPR